MQRLQERHIFRRISRSWVAVFILFIFLLLMIRASWGAYQKNIIIRNNRTITEESLLELDSRRERIKERINSINNPAGLEYELRSRFNIAKPGEQIIIVVDPEEG